MTGKLITPQGLTRRSVLKGTAAIGAAALAMPLARRAHADGPKRGGVLRIGLAAGSSTDSYDPAAWESQFVQILHTARCGYLTEIEPDGSVVGEVAESWEASDDATVWTFKIRDGVTYHSGKSVTPDDVVASINHHRGEASTSPAKPIVDPIQDIRVDGGNVVFTINPGNADFAVVLSDYHLPVLPSADGKIDPMTRDGCGGYMIDAWEPGVNAALSRYPNYWKPDRAWFDGVEILAILDSTARQNALLTGQVDVIDQLDRRTISMMQRAANIEILATVGNQHYTFAMDTRTAPFNDNNVRQALKYAVDRQELVDKILYGYGSVGNDHPIGPSQLYFNTEMPQRTYDPDKAKYYLKQAGLDSLDVRLSAADAAFVGAVEAGVLYSETAAAAGINITVDREPNDGYWSNVWMKKPWVAVYWGGRPTADWMFSTAYEAGAAWNDTFWDNARFNELLHAARAELNDDLRREMYFEMQEIVSNDGGTVIPMFASYVMGLSDKVGHPEKVAANWTLDGFRAPERWWFS